jgi:hypothetical protein
MMTETLEAQIDRLANFIIAEVPGEPSQSEGAVDTAIRWMRSALAARSAPEAGKAVVKPLEWESERTLHIADWLAGTYIISTRIDGSAILKKSIYGKDPERTECASFQAAKAAAQADFEQRILSALASVAPSGAEPVAVRVKHKSEGAAWQYLPLPLHEKTAAWAYSGNWTVESLYASPQAVPAEDVADTRLRVGDYPIGALSEREGQE